MIMWSTSSMSMSAPAATNCLVTSRSSIEGVGSRGVGVKRVAGVAVSTFLRASPQTGRASFKASGFPLSRFSGESHVLRDGMYGTVW